MRVVQMKPFSPQEKSGEYASVPPLKPAAAKSFTIDIKSFKKDDWILLAIIFVLIIEGSVDYPLLCALGYLFIMGL